jgi:hypothetical protein
LHDGSDLGYQLGVSDATFPIPRPTSKAASPRRLLLHRRLTFRGSAVLLAVLVVSDRRNGEMGYPSIGCAAKRPSVDGGHPKPITEPATASTCRGA